MGKEYIELADNIKQKLMIKGYEDVDIVHKGDKFSFYSGSFMFMKLYVDAFNNLSVEKVEHGTPTEVVCDLIKITENERHSFDIYTLKKENERLTILSILEE